MASLTRDASSGAWLARWRDPGGHQRKKSFRRKADGQRWLDQMQAETQGGQYIDPRAARIKIGVVLSEWAASLSHVKESTAERYRGIVRFNLMPQFESWRLDALKHSDIQRWLAQLSHSGLSPSSVRQCHRVLSLALDTAVDDGRIATNPAHRVKLPKPRRAEPRFLDADEVASMARAAGTRGLDVAVLALCGLRFGEFAALRVRDVDLDRHRFTVAGSVTEVGVFDPAARHIGRNDISPQDLRHTAASLAIRAGANVKAVQRMLGHASAAMTLDVYAGLFEDDLGDVAAALDRIMSKTAAPTSDTGRE